MFIYRHLLLLIITVAVVVAIETCKSHEGTKAPRQSIRHYGVRGANCSLWRVVLLHNYSSSLS